MNYCDNCDIVYDERKCPLCEAKDIIDGLENDLENMQKEAGELTAKIESMEEDARLNS